MTRVPRAAVFAGGAVIAVAVAPAAARAAAPVSVACGQVVRVTTVLARDVGPCPGDGIIVGADGITLDLNGHRVIGPVGPDDSVGIRLFGRTGVGVQGGTVSGFGAGIAIFGGARNTVTNVTVSDNIGLLDGSGSFGDGIAMFGSIGNVLRSSVVRHNGPFDGVGVFGARSTGNQILGNVIEDNNVARFVPAAGLMLTFDDGINLGAGVGGGSHTTIDHNRIRANGLNGIDACSNRGEPCLTTDDVITDNLVQGNGFGDPLNPDLFDTGDGIHVVGITPPGGSFEDFFPPTREHVADNLVTGNAGNGILIGSSDNQILDNVVVGNARSPVDIFFDLQDVSIDDNCDSNVWRGNTYGTASPDCTAAGGRQVGTTAPALATTGTTRSSRPPVTMPARRLPRST